MNHLTKLFLPDYSIFFLMSVLFINTFALANDNLWIWLLIVPTFLIESWVQYQLFEDDE